MVVTPGVIPCQHGGWHTGLVSQSVNQSGGGGVGVGGGRGGNMNRKTKNPHKINTTKIGSNKYLLLIFATGPLIQYWVIYPDGSV
jgi:hypothetical protein